MSDPTYFSGLWALLNSIYAYHNCEYRVCVFSHDLEKKQEKAIRDHPLLIDLYSTSELPFSSPGTWEAKQQMPGFLIPRARLVYLLDADVVLTSTIDDVFDSASKGKIVSSSDGGRRTYGTEYKAYGTTLPGQSLPYINSGALCLDIHRHWDLVGLWSFAAQFGTYSPNKGIPLRLPGHGDQGVLNAILGTLNRTDSLELLPEAEWCDCTIGCSVEIEDPALYGALVVTNQRTGNSQRLLHSSGPKWWTEDGKKHLSRFGDKLNCFEHFHDMIPIDPNRPNPATQEGWPPRILIGACSCEKNRDKREAVRDTWFQTLPANVQAVFFLAGSPDDADQGDMVVLDCPDTYAALPLKGQCFYAEALRRFEFDFLLKCDDDTYVVPARLENLVLERVDLAGSTELDTLNFASGGAGYLMSRACVEAFVKSKIPPTGPEDVIFSRKAKELRLSVRADHRLRSASHLVPTKRNDIITAHPCGPKEMRELHQRAGNHEACLGYYFAKHPMWQGYIWLRPGGRFQGGGADPNGSWRYAGENEDLELNWDHWPPDQLRRVDGGFRGEKLVLSSLNPLMEGTGYVTYSSLESYGRLGNQLFQIAATLGIAEQLSAKLVLPKWDYGLYFENPLPLGYLDPEAITRFNESRFRPRLPDTLSLDQTNLDLHGYFQNPSYFANVEEEVRNVFRPEQLFEETLRGAYQNLLENETCSLHVRRGDYVSSNIHTSLPLSYYHEAMSRFSDDTRFMVFSDDLEWCRANLKGEQISYIDGNSDVSDLVLMSLCDHHIIANSSFSWWGAWLGRNAQRRVLAPKRWYNNGSSFAGYCPTWELL